MIGHHAAQFILDTYEKGYRDFDVDQAYAAMRKNATEATNASLEARLANRFLTAGFISQKGFPGTRRGGARISTGSNGGATPGSFGHPGK